MSYTDISPRSAGERMKLAEGLLLASASESLDLEELEASGDLVLVSNPQLYGRLIALIKDKSLPLTQRRFATSLIEYCGDDISPAELLAVVTDPDDDHELRRDALSALKFTKIEEQCDAIIALARSGTDKDERHELRALALRLVYPKLAGAGDVIRILIPFYDGTFDSSYHHFCMHLLRNLRDAELPGALAAVADIARRRYSRKDDLRNVVLVVSGIGKRSFAHLMDAAVRDGLANMILAIPDNLNWVSWSDTLHIRGMPAEATNDLRRELLMEVATRAPDTKVAKVLLEIPFLVREEDLEWLAREAASLPAGIACSIMCTLGAEIAREGARRSAVSALRKAGLDATAAQKVARSATKMPRNFDRWTPPRWFSEGQTQSDSDESDGEPRDPDEGSVLDALSDLRLRQLQQAAPGRGEALAVEPSTLLALAENAESRLVRDNEDLSVVVIESLARAQQRLKGQTPMVRSLWNETSKGAEPKAENFLSDFIADHLRMDLVGRAIAADREVEIRPRIITSQGQRTDIRIQAFSVNLFGSGRHQIATLTIEVKGCWNPDLFTAMETQLRDRYMVAGRETVGLFLVGWYVCESWKAPLVAGRVKRGPGALQEIKTKLSRQAEALSSAAQKINLVSYH